MNRLIAVLCLAVVALSATALPLHAFSYVWTNTDGTNDFFDSTNWSCVPPVVLTTVDTLTVDTTGTAAPVVSATGLTVAKLYIGKAFTGTPAASVPGKVTVATGGVLNVAGSDLQVGVGTLTTPGQSELIIDGGTLNKASGSNFTVGNTGGNGLLTMTSGTINCAHKLIIGDTAGSTGEANISGGTINATYATDGISIGRACTGTWNQTGGSTNTYSSRLVLGGTIASLPTFNLGGGVFATAGITLKTASAGIIKLNGGTLKANATSADFIPLNSSYTVKVATNGAKFDSNGFAITVQMPLVEDGSSLGGGLTKSGLGTLTLSGANTYTGPTAVQAGALILANDTAFSTAATRAITVSTGATLGSNRGVTGYIVGTNSANVAFSDKSHLLSTSDGSALSTLAIGTLSSANSTDKVIVDIAIAGTTYPADGTYDLLTYVAKGASSPTFLTTLDGSGRQDVLVTDTANAIKLTITNNTTRGWLGADGSNWNNALNWNGGIPNGTDKKAWFDDNTPGFDSMWNYTPVLNADATVCSMLFNSNALGDNNRFAVQGSSMLTLQSSIAEKTQIQVLTGVPGKVHSIDPNITMVGTPIISVATGSSLTLNGVVSGSDNSVGINLSGGGTLTLNNVANSYTGVTAVTGGSTLAMNYWPSKCLLTDSNLNFINTAPCAATSVLTLAGTTASIRSTGADVAIPGDQLSISATTNVKKQGSGNVNITYNDTNTYSLGNFLLFNKGTIDVTDSKLSTGASSWHYFGAGDNAVLNLRGEAKYTMNGLRMANYINDPAIGDLSTIGGAVNLNLSDSASLVTTTGSIMFARTVNPTGVTFSTNAANAPKVFISIEDTASIISGSDIRCGDANYSTCDVTMSGGSMTAVTGIGFAYGYDASSKLNISGGTITGETITFGNKGGSQIKPGEGLISGGTFTATAGITIGLNTNYAASVNGTDIDLDISGAAAFTTPASILLADLWTGGTTDVVATVDMSGTSSMTAGTEFIIANGKAGAVGNLTMSGESWITAGTDFPIGNAPGGTGTLTMSGSSSVSAKTWLAVGNAEGAIGALTMTGNSSATVIGTTEEAGELQVGWGGTGTLDLGGTPTDTVRVSAATVQLGGSAGAIGTINLKAGSTLSTGRIYSEATPASSIVNFNGGVLKATASDGVNPETLALIPFINNDGASTVFELNVLAGGAIINTNSFDVTIDEVLKGTTGDGGLKKNGEGMLTLALDPTYTGDTVVNAGTLKVTNLNTPSAEVYVATGGILNATSVVANALTIGGPQRGAIVDAAPAMPVPEPGTLALLALAGMGVLLAAWRRK